jgi:hypothetical protein
VEQIGCVPRFGQAEWLRGFVSEPPVEFIPAAEPFWSPDKPVSGLHT